jgi:outer membrane receptor protein involved in Fe transport
MRKSFWLLSAALVAVPAPLFAQQADPGQPTQQTGPEGQEEVDQANTAGQGAVADTGIVQQPVDSGDVIITAQRRNQALSDVPMAVSAVNAENLRNSGATDIRQLDQLSPSLLVSSTQSEAGASVARIRGVGTVGDNPGLENSVGVFIDGVYRSRTGMGLTELGPLERIEVLRGPQGTLFGRNTSAGLISVITAQPRFQPEISGAITYGNYDYWRVEGSATGPISSTLAARVDGVWMKRDGFVTDVISGRDVNDRDRWLLRGQLLYEPSSDLSVRIVGDYTQRREECCAAVYLTPRDFTSSGAQPSTFAGILGALGAVIDTDPYDREVSITPGRDYQSDVDDWGLSGEVNYDFGAAQLTSITAYRENKNVRGQDIDYNNLDLFYRPGGGGSNNRFRTFTQELRLNGKALEGRLDWLVGAYYANEKLRSVDNVTYGADLPRYANCVVAATFASQAGAPTLVNPLNPYCFNQAVAGALLPAFGANATALAAFAGLDLTAVGGPNFGAAPFGTSGFANIATAFGVPGQSLATPAMNDDWNQTSDNWAIFTHNIFSITDRIDLTLGARYTHEKKTATANLSDNNTLCSFYSAFVPALQQIPCVFVPSTPGGSFSQSDSLSEGKLTGTAVLSYKPTDQLLTYASYSRGYKAGGFNLDRAALLRSGGSGAILPQSDLEALKFKPETVDAFELGAKYNGRGFDLNVAVFRELFTNFQLNTFNGLNFIVENINSCKEDLGGDDIDNDPATGACTGDTGPGVRSQGFEVEAFTRPLDYLEVNAGVTYADTKYRDNLVGADGKPLTTALFQLPGRRISNSNLWTVTGAVAWTPPIGATGMSALVYADARHMSGFNTGSDLDLEKFQKAFTTVNARLGIRGRNDAWAIEVWAQNLFDEKFEQVAFDAPLQGSGTERGVLQGFYGRATQLYGAFLGEPRTFGVTVRANWSPPPAPMPTVAPPAPPPPEAPATQTCADGTVILATGSCPAPPPPAPVAPAQPERG